MTRYALRTSARATLTPAARRTCVLAYLFAAVSVFVLPVPRVPPVLQDIGTRIDLVLLPANNLAPIIRFSLPRQIARRLQQETLL